VDESPNGIHRAGGVCQHGGDADKKATEPPEDQGIGKVLEEFAAEFADELEDEHEEDDDSNDTPGGLVIQSIEEEPGTNNRCQGDGDERPNHLPTRVFTEERVDEKIADDEHGQNNADTVFGAEEFRDKEDVDDGQSRKPGLRDTKAESSQAGEGESRTGGIKG
jgi:hypothetical protein